MVLPLHSDTLPFSFPYTQPALVQPPPSALLLSPVQGSNESDHFSFKRKLSVLDPQHL